MKSDPTNTVSPARVTEGNKWSLSNLPPEGHKDVGGFAYSLFDAAMAERDRLCLEARWNDNHRLYRNQHFADSSLASLIRKSKKRLSLNFLAANIQRTVANITARAPVAMAQSVDGADNGADDVMSEKLSQWNNMEEQQASLTSSVFNQEIYGITIEKAVYDAKRKAPRPVVLDQFAGLPAPGNWRTLNDAPYMIHLYTLPVDSAEKRFEVEGLTDDADISQILGEEREENALAVPTHTVGAREGVVPVSAGHVPTSPKPKDRLFYQDRCLIAEIWVRDYSTVKRKRMVEEMDPATGEPLVFEIEEEVPRYPGGIRVITITNKGNKVLSDTMNPNVNWELPTEMVENSYLYDRFPFYKSNSYEDTTSLWGFSMAEMVADINLAIDDLWSMIASYLRMALHPPLILPQDCNIPLSKVRYIPRLVLQPASSNTANAIRWLEMPTPPSWLFQALDTLLAFFDRISQVEDADRGSAPGQVVAASAIQMLQERGAVLVRAKIRAVDRLVRERGRCFISFYQNFNADPEAVTVGDQQYQLRGLDMLPFKFDYIVESGSTVAKTEAQQQQQAMELYAAGAIDRRALLEKLKFDKWKEVIERMGENELDTALNVLMAAGMPEDMAMQLRQMLMQPQGGPGDSPNVGQPGAPAQAGTPKAQQGA